MNPKEQLGKANDIILKEYNQFEPFGIFGFERRGKKYIDVLGVELERAKVDSGKYVPSLSEFKNYVLDVDALAILQELAIAFRLGIPIYIEGGTSIGKTKAVRFICALCGYEYHYVQVKADATSEDFMGRFVPNDGQVKRYYDFEANCYVQNSSSVDFIYQEGMVTSGLIQEKGKIKVILLDEFNAAKQGIAIRLHEVVDAVKDNINVILTEAHNEVLTVSNRYTKLVALQNPPGGGYLKREPIDPAQLRRWIYQKNPSHLSDTAFEQFVDHIWQIGTTPKKSERVLSIESQEYPLIDEQLTEIPGWIVIERQYKDFHKTIVELLHNDKKFAKDQPQRFSFDAREEALRVKNFILHFYDGDITTTIQNALRFFYKNKLESVEDRQKVEELINLVEYRPPSETSKRVPLHGRLPVVAKTLRPNYLPGIPSENQPTSHSHSKTRAEVKREHLILKEQAELENLIASWTNEMFRDTEIIDLTRKGLERDGYRKVSKESAEDFVIKAKAEFKRILEQGPLSDEMRSKLNSSQVNLIYEACTNEQRAISELENLIKSMNEPSDADFII